MSNKAAFGLLLAFGLIFAPADMQAQGRPMSAIDWLSDTVAKPTGPALQVEAPIKPIGELAQITTSAISDRNLDAVGILPVLMTGLDQNLWAGSTLAHLGEVISQKQGEPLPALRDLFQTLMLAEVAPPMDADGSGAFLLARVDRLLELAALEPAQALIHAAGKPTPELFRRAFDIALLLGTENEACAVQRAAPRIAPTFPARIFCLARNGDWAAAALTFNTAQALGHITPEEEAIIERFLDTESFEEETPLAPPERVTPLTLRLYEAIGEALAPTGLPLAFAFGDLSPNNGWKARLEAGERLARTGAIPPQQIMALYTERAPAASGGVWDRARAVQTFERALEARDTKAMAKVLPSLWQQLSELELEVAFAAIYGQRLAESGLTGPAGDLAFRIGLLGPSPEEAAKFIPEGDPEAAFLAGLASGFVDVPPPPSGLARAIAPVFGTHPPQLSQRAMHYVAERRQGEALILAMSQITAGAMGDLRGVTEGLSTLRLLGQDMTARKAALQLMLLERRG